MKTFTTSLLAFFLAIGMVSAQVVFVNSPDEIMGGYDFEDAANFGADVSTDVWTGDAKFIDDGTGATASLGCEAAVNDLTGNIALIDRGSCAFVDKTLNAQNAGAIAVIIFNNNPGEGPIGLGGENAEITIPAVCLSYEDGQIIRAILENEPVNITIGNVIFENNISFADSNISLPGYGIFPESQLGDGNFVFTPGANFNNEGTASAENVTIDATIEYTPFGGSTTEVYSESGAIAGPVMTDSVSDLQVLPMFEFTEGPGQYTITYEASSDTEDELSGDNTISRTVTISEGLVSKARWDMAENAPDNTSTFYTGAGGGDIQFSVPIHLPNGAGGNMDTLIWRVLKTDPNLAGIAFDGFVYQWDDMNGDTLITNDEVSIAGIAPFEFSSDETATSAIIRAPILDINTFDETGVPITDNDTYYIIAARYTGPEQVFFGFDEMYDHSQNQQILGAQGAITDLDLNYLGSNAFGSESIPDFEADAFRFTGILGASVSLGVTVSGLVDNTTEAILDEEALKISLFPNPTTEFLNVQLNLKHQTSYLEYSIRDASGKQVFLARDNSVFQQEQETLNVKQLPAGQYFLTIRTEQGIQTASFVVNN